jgi:hypothetical protein
MEAPRSTWIICRRFAVALASTQSEYWPPFGPVPLFL